MAFCWVILFLAFPGICFALYKLCSQVRPDQVAPVYVTNLLISDLIQVCTNSIASALFLVSLQGHNYLREALVLLFIYIYSLQVNIFFMMCISAERYIMIAHAVWYRNIQTRRTSVIVSVLMWILPAVPFILVYKCIRSHGACTESVLLLPYPLVMFFFVATWRALSRTSVPRNDQIRIRSILALILLIYTILFLPYIVKAGHTEPEQTTLQATTHLDGPATPNATV
ncbi:G-protein coupled receptor 4-like [Engraulis encrasicolus]|uniref:G-protein coupled receptor 4-like n=1 Tax=Engraulis encrasicolus TaxID=184585 RepID=UPI002FD2E442